MDMDDLSSEQRAVLGLNVRLVEACPGAGKTRAIVARFNVEAQKHDGGVALVSFTNAAADEALRRSSTDSSLSRSPNFVGTFDSFLHRFVVTPWYRRVRNQTPSYLESWDELNVSWSPVRYKGVNGAGLKLSSFSPDDAGHVHYASEPPTQDRTYVQQLAKASPSKSPFDLTPIAQQKINGLVSSGTLDCDNARVRALHILDDTTALWLHRRLANRFKEVIVDEFQDCSVVEHKIIAALQKLGINVVVVADPDQSIYAFRRATPEAFAAFKAKLTDGQIVKLTKNYRSTEAICDVVTSLRSISTDSIRSEAAYKVGEAASEVIVVSGSSTFQRTVFKNRASALGISDSSAMVLAATRKGAAELSGQPPVGELGKGSTGKIVRALSTLRASTSAMQRRDALRHISEVILGSFKWSPAFDQATTKARIEALEIDPHFVNSIARELLVASRNWIKATDARTTILSVLGTRLSNLPIQTMSLGLRFRQLEVPDWAAWQESQALTEKLPSLHIHAVKGLEFEAVMLEIPDLARKNQTHVLNDWEGAASTEARRVLYVGASRARRLLVLAISPRHESQLKRILAQLSKVEYVRESAS